jgi:hypothetical protein
MSVLYTQAMVWNCYARDSVELNFCFISHIASIYFRNLIANVNGNRGNFFKVQTFELLNLESRVPFSA